MDRKRPDASFTQPRVSQPSGSRFSYWPRMRSATPVATLKQIELPIPRHQKGSIAHSALKSPICSVNSRLRMSTLVFRNSAVFT
jgi:hypothetical protein